MKQSISNNQVYGFLPTDIEGVDILAELALDLRWSWNHAIDETRGMGLISGRKHSIDQ